MRNTPNIIAICGGIHCGKSTILNELLLKLPEYTEIKFADPIKQYLSYLSSKDIKLFEEGSFKQKYDDALKMTPRKAMIDLGRWTKDTFGEDIYAKSLFSKKLNNVIISDLRHLKEAEYVKKNGGIIIRVDRYFDLRFPGLSEYTHNENRYNFNDRALSYEYPELYFTLIDASETEWMEIKYDYLIHNNDNNTTNKVDKLIQVWQKEY
jgi:hypothetical protein